MRSFRKLQNLKIQHKTVVLSALLMLMTASQIGQASEGRRQAQHTKYALLVGVGDNIQPVNRLYGPDNDVAAVKQLLIAKYGFKPEHITVLLGKRATRAGILKAFDDQLIRPVKQGDLAFFYYSGHGTLIPAKRPEEEPTGMDSALCPYDAVDESGLIIDDEIGALIDRIPTDEVALVVDACNSGTANREGRLVRSAPASRFGVKVPPPTMAQIRAKLAAPLSRDVASDQGKECYIGAAGDEQKAEEDYFLANRAKGRPTDDDVMGALTYYMLQALREDTHNTLTYTTLLDKVRVGLKSNNLAQIPEAHGRHVADKRFLLLPEETPDPPQPGPGIVPSAEVTAIQGDTITARSLAGAPLQAGSILEATKSRKWVLASDDVKRTDDSGVAQVVAVHGMVAECRKLHGKFEVGDRLVETFHGLIATKLRVALTGDRTAAGDLAQTLAALPDVEITPATLPHDIELSAAQTPNGAEVTPFLHSLPLPVVPLADTPQLVRNLATVQKLAQLNNPTPPFHVTLHIDGQAGQTDAHIGGTVTLEITSDADVYLYLIDVAAAGKIAGADNMKGMPLFIKAGAVLKLPPIPVQGPAGLDTVKVIASIHPLNVHLDVKTSPDGKIEDAAKTAEDLMRQLRDGINKVSSRSLDFSGLVGSGSPVSTEGWATDTVSLHIKP